MGDQALGAQTALPKESSYKIISHKGSQIPNNYQALIFGKWLRSLKHGNDFFKLHDSESYFYHYHNYIERLLLRPEAKVKFAVLTIDPDVVLGWACVEPNKLHYVWVQPEQRFQGIATELCKDPFHTVTHLTTPGIKILSTLQNVKFDAYA